jgi:hypothetical protein
MGSYFVGVIVLFFDGGFNTMTDPSFFISPCLLAFILRKNGKEAWSLVCKISVL